MSLKTLNESLERILLLETKQDIENFKNKFGEDNYELFNKSLQRLKNNGYSTDIIYYTQKVSKEELEDLLSKLQRRLQTKSTENNNVSNEGIQGKYKYLGEKDGYKVYQPLDYLASIDLGYMSGWCTTGRYGHAGERNCKPSKRDAKGHFNDYTSKGIKLYYFLDSKTMEGKYAIALYPKLLKVNKFVGNYYLKETNFELFNQEDVIDYSALNKIPYQLIPEELVIEKEDAPNGLYIKDNVLVKANKNIKKAIIPNSIKSIGDTAFCFCYELESITIPNSVISIGGEAFYDCSKLTSITIPNSVTSIGSSAFQGCSSFTSITIPNSVTSISNWAFSHCTNLTNITIPNGVVSIGNRAFESCKSLTSITLPDSITNIGKYAFISCYSLTDITLSDNITSIGSYAFSDCESLTSITIPNSVKEIGYGVFRGCSKLTSITIPNSVKEIEYNTFQDCSSLTSITIPDSVISIGQCAFEDCSSLTMINFNGTKTQWYNISTDYWWNRGTGNYTVYCTDGNIPKQYMV